MTRRIAVLIALCLTSVSQQASANDIIDFLRAVSGPRIPQQYGYRHSYAATSRYAGPQSRSQQLPMRSRFEHTAPSPAVIRPHLSRRPVTVTRPRSSFKITFHNRGVSPSVVQSAFPTVVQPTHQPPILPPARGSFSHLPHQYGDFVTCNVPRFTQVIVKDKDEMAPNAIPVIVAVRSPNLGRFRTCIENVVYVEVWVPPCPLQRVRVSSCKTKIRLDYWRHEVDIISRNGLIEIDYDN